MSCVKCQMSSVKCQMSTAYVDPWDIVNNFCFHVSMLKSGIFEMSSVKWLCCSLGHAEQLLFSCLCLKVIDVIL